MSMRLSYSGYGRILQGLGYALECSVSIERLAA